jgi:poly(hydroxyalkanoate) granule-associated protein
MEITMAKKLKNLAADSNLAATIRDSAQQIWLAGLGAYAKAQQEGNKVFDALVREGEAIQSATRKMAEDKVQEMAAKATGTWDKLEAVFENRVSKALNSLGVPTKADIDALAKRVADLTAEVEKLNGGTAAPKAAPRRRAAAAEVVEVVEEVAEVVKAPARRRAAKAAAAPAEAAAE